MSAVSIETAVSWDATASTAAILGWLAFVVAAIRLQMADARHMRWLNALTTGLLSASYAVLGGYSGAATLGTACIRSLILQTAPGWRHRTVIGLVAAAIAIAIAALVWAGPVSLLPMAGIVLATIADTRREVRHMRATYLVAHVVMAVYAAMLDNAGALAVEVIGAVSAVIGALRIDWRRRSSDRADGPAGPRAAGDAEDAPAAYSSIDADTVTIAGSSQDGTDAKV